MNTNPTFVGTKQEIISEAAILSLSAQTDPLSLNNRQ